MPVPNNPTTEKARAQRKVNAERRRLEAAAALLREAGWTVAPPSN